jgi:hypothetical protein
MSDETATAIFLRERDLRMDLRRARTMQLTHAVMQAIEPFIRDEDGRERRDVYEALVRLFNDQGVEILTDFTRAEAGLPPRGPDGWTDAELRALEARRLEVMLRPISMVVPAP